MLLLDGQVHYDTLLGTMGNYVIAFGTYLGTYTSACMPRTGAAVSRLRGPRQAIGPELTFGIWQRLAG
jgi:hypothetical protein